MQDQANDTGEANNKPDEDAVELEASPAGAGTEECLPFLPIANALARPDFPQCALGMRLDIAGTTGVVTEVMKQSIRLQSPDGTSQRYNVNRLRQLYGPRIEVEPQRLERMDTAPSPSEAQLVSRQETEGESKPAAPERVESPDFDQPVRPVSFYAGQPDFPRNTFGKLLDIAGYSGVVVAIVSESLKVRSPEGGVRSFNAVVLRKLYGRR